MVFAGEALGHISGNFFNPCVHAVEVAAPVCGSSSGNASPPLPPRLSAFVQLCASAEAPLKNNHSGGRMTEQLDASVVGAECAERFAAGSSYNGSEFMQLISASRISSNFPREDLAE